MTTYFPYYVVVHGALFFLLLGSTKSQSFISRMKVTEQYLPVVLFTTLYKAISSFESMDEI